MRKKSKCSKRFEKKVLEKIPNISRTFQIWNPRKQEEEVKVITFLLPHELMGCFSAREQKPFVSHFSILQAQQRTSVAHAGDL